ncbi:hypothetical protein CUMW_156450 [Citrus unshiu]|uniref:Uncharacterized protein n=1 Tax=Citrus unshiu TaxID=55188 RepID=A0A2H5PPW7_CITUN|nr:hypothetical protein CUMW_156450 [Citrus unshiu]
MRENHCLNLKKRHHLHESKRQQLEVLYGLQNHKDSSLERWPRWSKVTL